MVTIKAKLIAKEHDFGGYTTYVFRNLEDSSFGKKYIMCTRFKNWQHRNIDIGEIGFLTVKEVIEGVDKWFDGTNMIPYNYTNIIFIKFVEEKKDNSKEIIL